MLIGALGVLVLCFVHVALLAFFHDYVLFCSYKCTIFHVAVNLFLIPFHLLLALLAGASSHLNMHLCYVLIVPPKIHIFEALTPWASECDYI